MGILDIFRKPTEPSPANAPGSGPAITPQPVDPEPLAHLVGGGMLGNVQVIGDTTHITQEQRDKLKAFGIDLDAVIASGGTSGLSGLQMSGLQFGAPDDSVSKLERLAALRDRGALTEAEFAAEKKKLLG